MILGEKEFIEGLEKLNSVDLYQTVSKGIKAVQGEAKSRCPVSYGELRDSIYTDVEYDSEYVRGICYTNKSYAPYVEFGTGPKGQAYHKGISPDVAVSYTQNPWWIHESQIDMSTAEKYHWFYIDTPDGRFYECIGQPAQPYMYPALKNQEPEIKKLFEEEIKKKI